MEDRNKIIDRILKLQRQSESELKLGNEGTAELFKEKAEEQTLKYSISLSEISAISTLEAKIEIINDLGITTIVNPFLRINAKTNLRQAWFEKLAEIIASAYNCKVCPTNSGELRWFGYDYDREVAIFMFLRIAATEKDKCDYWRNEERKNVGKAPLKQLFSKKEITYPKEWMGDEEFNEGFHFGFRISLNQNYEEYEVTQELRKKRQEVLEFYSRENPTPFSYYNYDNSMEFLEEKSYNSIAVDLGKRSGKAVSKQANKNPSYLAITNERLQEIESDIVYLLIDNSFSMHGDKIQQAKDGALLFAKEAISSNKAVGVVSFSRKAELILRPQREVNEKFKEKIEKIEVDSSTNLTDALRLAKSYFTSRRVKRSICVVTDGMPDNATTAIAIANDCKREGIKIIAIGTDGARQEFLDELCSEKGLGLLVNRTDLLLTMGEIGKRI